MTQYAIAVLESAVAEAQDSPVPPSPAVRLALSWLTLEGVAQAWQVQIFWTALTKTPENPERMLTQYIRLRDMQTYLDAWKRAS